MTGTEAPTPEQTALWRRRLASQANNRAWDLSESLSRTEAENDEMLSAAHAAAFFWNIVGNDKNRANAELLLAHVYALLGLAAPATRHLAAARRLFGGADFEPSGIAINHIVAANVAAVCGDTEAHSTHYTAAVAAIDALPELQNRQLLGASLRTIPKP